MLLGLQVALWYVAIQAAALAVLPLTQRIFARFPDRGYAFSRPLGLLLLAWGVWLPGMLSFLDYTRGSLLVALAALAAICWLTWGRSTASWLRTARGPIVFQEALFLLLLVAAVAVRIYNPDVNGQEKFMDMAFFNGFMSTRVLPAEDAWLSGFSMPYYPFGYLLMSVPARLAGLPAAVGYNLALVLTGAMATTLCVSLAANVLASLRRVPTPRRADWVFGLLAGFLVMVAGNLDGPLEILAARGFNPPGFWEAVGIKNLKAAPSGNWLPVDGGWWWHGSRVIPTIQPDGITEFPYFSFLLGDLHPHFTALSLDLLVLALVLALLLEGTPRTDWPWRIVSGLALGVLIVANTWDVATFWLLFGVASALVLWRAAGGWRIGWGAAESSLWPIGIAIAGYFPYFIGYSSQRLGLAFVEGGFTPLVSLGIIFGPMLALCLLLVLRPAIEGQGAGVRAIRPALLSVMVAVILLAAGRQTLAVATGLLGLLLVRAWPALQSWRGTDGETGRSVSSGGTAPAEAALVYTYLLAGLGVAIVAAVEVIYIRDVFGTRMNTVFKFYYHAWVLLGLAAAVAAGLWCLRIDWSWRPVPARALAGGLTVAVVGLGLVYPIASTMSKSSGYREPTLDGMAFLSRARPGEAEAIRWLSSQAGRPVVLEAVGPAYSEFARVATFSGLPTVLGWDNHENQWRGPLVEFAKRKQDVETIYRRGDAETALPILQRYGVRYVFVGSLEREAYGRDVESRFARWLEPVFRREGVTVFAVPSVGGAA